MHLWQIIIGVLTATFLIFLKNAHSKAYQQKMAATRLVGGLLGILGSIFDTPANDRMAMTQGRHFVQFFAKGATSELNNLTLGSSLSVATPAILSASTPSSSGLGGGNVSLHFHGPITDEQFIKNTIVPAIEQVALDGGSRIVIDDQNITGGSSLAFA